MKNSGWQMAAGYMTVEATLIIPLVMYVCISILYLGIFQYDRCLMRQDAYRAALQGSSAYRGDNRRVYNRAFRFLEDMSRDKYFATGFDYHIEVQGKALVTTEGYVSMPFRGIENLVKAAGWTVNGRAESNCINPVVFIRLCRKIEKGITEGEE